jgi:beta-phosphoglucomutase-like phosphatase (HAD superfamily)
MLYGVKAVIFDMDGVLVDSQPLHFEADIKTLANFGADAGLEDVERCAGMALADRLRAYSSAFGLNAPLEKMIGAHRLIIGRLLSESRLGAGEGVIDILKFFEERRFPMAVASSSPIGFVFDMLTKINARDYFSVILSGEDVERSKPAPDIFLKASAKLKIAPPYCLVIEDAENGVAAAVAAGTQVIGYKNLSSGKQDLSRAGMVIERFSELKGMFL